MSMNPIHGDAFEARGRSFEEAYFRGKDAELVGKLRQVFDAKTSKEELRKATGISNEQVLDQLAAASLHGESLTAFKLFPLVELAWADGTVTKAESDAVINAAVKSGIAPSSPALGQMKEWLERGPTEDGRAMWLMYAAELRKVLSAAQLTTFRDDLLKHAHKVAEASGGVFGIATTSVSEQRVIDKVSKALSPA
jgi:hypothetical protein